MKKIYLLLVVVISAVGCGKPKTEVIQGKIERGQIGIVSKIPGKIIEIRIQEGDFVRKGDTLAILDIPEVDAKKSQAEGAVQSAKAQYDMTLKGATDNQLKQLEAKQKALASEQEKFNKIKKDFETNAQRLKELEDLIAAKEAGMKKLKDALSKSLKAFEGKGLSVTQKDGKVYVSMENKLLFESGSWTVGSEGKKAVDLVSKVLAENSEIAVLIEGHTDNDKITGTIGGGVENNWDLSTKRATAIVTILTANPKVNKANITAAGRSEYAPLMSNETAEGKAKNRRIEIILTPKLDEISKLLNEL